MGIYEDLERSLKEVLDHERGKPVNVKKNKILVPSIAVVRNKAGNKIEVQNEKNPEKVENNLF